MSLSFVFVLIPTICYGGASIVYGMQRNWPMSVVYLGYMVANLGLLALDRIMSK